MRNTTFLLIWVLCFTSAQWLAGQPFAVGHTTMTFTDPSRNNRQIVTEIYYPAINSGDNTAIATAATYPVIAFGHGFLMGFDAYENIWTAIVPQGFIVALPTTEGGFAPSHANFGKDLAFIIEQLELMNGVNTAFFYQRISQQSAVMGHSMGGGAAFLAATETDAIEAIATLAPANTNPSSIDAASTLGIPALVIAGANDCVTPPSVHQVPMYNALVSACKTYISITGGSHCQMAESNLPCNVGELTCSPAAAISREAQHNTINSYLVNWLKATLLDNCAAGESFDTAIVGDNTITFQKTCLQCEQLSSSETNRLKTTLLPNPLSTNMTLHGTEIEHADVTLYDVQGRLVFQQRLHVGVPADVASLPSGLYLYVVMSENNKFSGKIVKN